MNLAFVDPSNPLADIGAIVVNGTDNASVSNNRIFGRSFCGLCMYGSSYGTLNGNNLNGLTVPFGLFYTDPDVDAMSADVVFAVFPNTGSTSNFNKATGPYTVWDVGQGNVVTGKKGAH